MAKSYQDLVKEAKSQAEQTDAEAVHVALESGEDVTIVDVREPAEWDESHIAGAQLIPRGLLEYQAADKLPDKNARIVVHCALGGRGALAAQSLKEMGYENVANMDGGVKGWREKGYETE